MRFYKNKALHCNWTTLIPHFLLWITKLFLGNSLRESEKAARLSLMRKSRGLFASLLFLSVRPRPGQQQIQVIFQRLLPIAGMHGQHINIAAKVKTSGIELHVGLLLTIRQLIEFLIRDGIGMKITRIL